MGNWKIFDEATPAFCTLDPTSVDDQLEVCRKILVSASSWVQGTRPVVFLS